MLHDKLTDALDLMEDNHSIVKRVVDDIMKGGSKLKKALAANEVTIADVAKSIRHNRCLRVRDQDLGSTYLEQTVASAIRDVIPISHINHARKLFGLDKLSKKDLVKDKGRSMGPR